MENTTGLLGRKNTFILAQIAAAWCREPGGIRETIIELGPGESPRIGP
jgi:hypothetical protein